MDKKTVIISPYSQKMRNNKENPKNFPWFPGVVSMLKQADYHIIQVGVQGEKPIFGVDDVRFNLSLKELKQLINESDTWVAVDNFFHHLASHTDKPGVVIWGKSDPSLFGYVKDVNLLKGRHYLRKLQFDIWEREVFTKDCFVKTEVVVEAIKNLANKYP
jgi:ADP-heptose:LPS heptosyltransferase